MALDENSPVGDDKSEGVQPPPTSRLKRLLRLIFVDLYAFLSSVLSLSEGLDREGTIEGIRKDVEFKGHAAWILIFSILIASIGLSVGNIPIIVGAMLISPLMGPILGIGLAAGTNDIELLRKSMLNLGISVVIGIVISAIYFLIIPIPEINIELRDRTQATLLAIGVALFGGAAGIIAGSRRQKSNVVPGVAIATALMPPLCTVGFGLATLRWEFFFGALYLFFINSVFIALPTYLYIRYMKFPMKEFIDPAKERRIRWRITVFLILTIVPSAFIFFAVLKESFFESDTKRFIMAVEQSLEERNTTVIDYKVLTDDGQPTIKIALIGDPISEDLRNAWLKMRDDFDLSNVALDIREPRDFTQAIEAIREESRSGSFEQVQAFYQRQIAERDTALVQLSKKLEREAVVTGDFNVLTNELKTLYPDLERLAFANFYESDFSGRVDTVATLMIEWREPTPQSDRRLNAQRLNDWLIVRLGKKVRVVNFCEGVIFAEEG